MTQDTPFLPENVAETMRRAIEDLTHHKHIHPEEGYSLDSPVLITVPNGRTVSDVTDIYRQTAEYFKPARRRGKARLDDLTSLIRWANRFKGHTSVLFARPDMAAPALTCIADYHGSGAAEPENPFGDPAARHLSHTGVYNFPLSDEWKVWMGVNGNPLDKDQMGEFIEANAKDVMDPTPAIISGKSDEKHQLWENRLVETARQIDGRYGQLGHLLAMSRQFAVHEVSNLTVTSNRDTGEASIQFLNEHRAPDGKPLSIPNLIIIAIPVFMGGAAYRMPVRFRYRKTGGQVKFILSIYNPERAFKDAFDEATARAEAETELPLFLGTPEA